MHFGSRQVALRLASRQQKVQQVVVSQVHQALKAVRLAHREAGLVLAEKAFDEEVVLEQATAAAPP